MKAGFLEKLIERLGRIGPEEVQDYFLRLAQEKGFLETVFNAIHEGIIVTDSSGRITYLNDAACKLFGLESTDAIGKRLDERVRGLDWKSLSPSGGPLSRDMEIFYPENRFINFYIVPLMIEHRDAPVAGGDDSGCVANATPSGVNAPGYSWRVTPAENYEPHDGRAVYRFFELFDLPNIPGIENALRANAEGRITITPPIKPYLEEKMWFALFWLQPLREFWRRELGEKYFIKLQEVIPYSWLLDPTPLPQHAVIPRLEIHDWREAAKFSQKDRDLLLKVSGFSPLGWGSRGIALGSDLAHTEWQKRIEHALATFESSPTILQRFHKGRLFEHNYWEPDSGDLKRMKGRVRLCPYYFVEGDRVRLRGALATIVPADKKFLHGMSDAILVPSKMQ
jgi:PAS domain-containing protein